MKRPPKFTCLFAASFMTITPYTPQQFLTLAKEQVSVSEKISILKRLSDTFPLDRSAPAARENLVNLLINDNRCEEALQIYQKGLEEERRLPAGRQGRAIDFKLLEMLLRTGRYNDVLRATRPPPPGPCATSCGTCSSSSCGSRRFWPKASSKSPGNAWTGGWKNMAETASPEGASKATSAASNF